MKNKISIIIYWRMNLCNWWNNFLNKFILKKSDWRCNCSEPVFSIPMSEQDTDEIEILYCKWSFVERFRFDHHSLKNNWIFMEKILLCCFRWQSILNITLYAIGLSSQLVCERCWDYTFGSSPSIVQFIFPNALSK